MIGERVLSIKCGKRDLCKYCRREVGRAINAVPQMYAGARHERLSKYLGMGYRSHVR